MKKIKFQLNIFLINFIQHYLACEIEMIPHKDGWYVLSVYIANNMQYPGETGMSTGPVLQPEPDFHPLT